MSVVRLTDVGFAYEKGAPILSNINSVFEDDISVALLGPSGSGKTTLLHLIGGLLRPTAGTIEAPKRCAWIHQSVTLLQGRSAIENAALGGICAGMTNRAAATQAVAMLDRVGLAGYEQRTVSKLSGGQAQRVGIARALTSNHRLILADEPTGHLDTATSADMTEVLVTRRPAGSSLIVATHDLSLAEECDILVDVAVLSNDAVS